MKKLLIIGVIFIIIFTGCTSTDTGNPNITKKDMELMLDSSKGTTIIAYHNIKDKLKLKWLESYVSKGIKSEYDIDVKFVYKPYEEYYKKLNKQYLEEDSNGKFDLLLYDDNSFKQLKNEKLLYGPFLKKVDNSYKYQDQESYEIHFNQGIPIEGYETLLGRNQLLFIYDEDFLENAPSTPEEIINALKDKKGKFTYLDPSTKIGRAYINSIFFSFVKYEDVYGEDLSYEELKTKMKPALDYFKKLKPYMAYKDGKLPMTQDEIDEMFYKKEIMFSMTFDIDHASTVSKLDLYPIGAKAFVFDTGTTGYDFYAAIPFNSSNKASAILSINYMLSLHAQNNKYDPKKWGNLPSLDSVFMKAEDAKILTKATIKRSDIKEADLLSVRIPEVPKDLSDKLYELWQNEIFNK
ncbi:ABC transporter substrate-binding protein [Helicovermis profundi]|uniref:ABC transporter substrate-binding protein n=1 Tax=Helicovermis profundi TaxID=3065157 RepID=A0AAU9E4Z6_9FIRM|nr:ABC transporter substrate-binding protein [Clostridia bacterium S502]